MIELLAILVVPLAVWRVSNMLADTDQSGPFEILSKLRAWAGVKFNEQSIPYARPGGIGDMLICVYCNSIWLGALFTIGLLINSRLTIIASLPFALSAVAIFIQERMIDEHKA